MVQNMRDRDILIAVYYNGCYIYVNPMVGRGLGCGIMLKEKKLHGTYENKKLAAMQKQQRTEVDMWPLTRKNRTPLRQKCPVKGISVITIGYKQ